MKLSKGAKHLLIRITITVAVILVLSRIFVIHRHTGNEMFPAVRDGDLCIFYTLDKLHLNDVVYYKSNDTMKVGRIVAMPNQTVSFENGFTVDDYHPSEEIFYETLPGKKTKVKLYDDDYYILNDYRTSKTDSRSFGAVSKSDIKGQLIFILRRRDF